MKKIAIFGKPGSGKSTLSRRLSSATGIPLYPLDSIMYKPDGEPVDRTIYDKKHQNILLSERWIIDGLGPIDSFYTRLDVADTLIYIDLPYVASYWLVTKRLLKGLFVTPEGWPEGSSVCKGTLESYRVLKLCPGFWNEAFLNRLEAISKTESSHAQPRSLYVIRSVAELNSFVDAHVRA